MSGPRRPTFAALVAAFGATVVTGGLAGGLALRWLAASALGPERPRPWRIRAGDLTAVAIGLACLPITWGAFVDVCALLYSTLYLTDDSCGIDAGFPPTPFGFLRPFLGSYHWIAESAPAASVVILSVPIVLAHVLLARPLLRGVAVIPVGHRRRWAGLWVHLVVGAGGTACLVWLGKIAIPAVCDDNPWISLYPTATVLMPWLGAAASVGPWLRDLRAEPIPEPDLADLPARWGAAGWPLMLLPLAPWGALAYSLADVAADPVFVGTWFPTDGVVNNGPAIAVAADEDGLLIVGDDLARRRVTPPPPAENADLVSAAYFASGKLLVARMEHGGTLHLRLLGRSGRDLVRPRTVRMPPNERYLVIRHPAGRDWLQVAGGEQGWQVIVDDRLQYLGVWSFDRLAALTPRFVFPAIALGLCFALGSVIVARRGGWIARGLRRSGGAVAGTVFESGASDLLVRTVDGEALRVVVGRAVRIGFGGPDAVIDGACVVIPVRGAGRIAETPYRTSPRVVHARAVLRGSLAEALHLARRIARREIVRAAVLSTLAATVPVLLYWR